MVLLKVVAWFVIGMYNSGIELILKEDLYD